MNTVLPQDSEDRKNMPLVTGLLDYFPAALAEVAKLSKAGNDKHNPGEPLHWARGKSMDHADCIARHLADRGAFDPKDGTRHSASLAWRALALLQEELEAEGAPLPRGARVAEPSKVSGDPRGALPGKGRWVTPVRTDVPREMLCGPACDACWRDANDYDDNAVWLAE
jgi:dATP/dGTP diphosphohydrolase